MLIPKTVHYIWLGGPIPDHLYEMTQTFVEHHPDWDVVWWDEKAIDKMGLQNRDVYDSAERLVPRDSVYQLKSDIARLEIVYRHGGAYADCDFVWYRSVNPFLEGASLVTVWERQYVNVSNGWIAAEPGNPELKRVIDAVPEKADSHNRVNRANRLTGPSGLWNDLMRTNKNVRILDQKYMLHAPWSRPEEAGVNPPEDALAAHIWNHQRTVRGLDK